MRVECLVLDVHLPGISGLEFLALLERDPAWRDPPVVATTSDPDHPAVSAAVARGAVAAVVPKPFDVDDLLEAIARVARGAGGAGQHARPAAGPRAARPR